MSHPDPLATPELTRFRAEVRDFLRHHLPDDIRRLVASESMELPKDYQRRWHKILRAQGWSCPAWPKEHGGPGWSDAQLYIYERELALADAPRAMAYGIHLLGPTLMAFGSPAQKARFLPPILEGDIFWCQGFSEPNAGSDLASLKCHAELQGDRYILNGTKMWTSEGHIADWMFGLFRTDSGGKKQQGITFLLLDMKSPGLSIRPIRTFDGGAEVNQVFFDNVSVPADQRVGEEHKGWTLAKYLLGLERFGIAEVSRSSASLRRLKVLAARPRPDGSRAIDDPAFAADLAEIEIRLAALDRYEARILFGAEGTKELGAEASILKVVGTEIQQRVLELMVDAIGADANFHGDDLEAQDEPGLAPEARFAARAFYNMRKTSIYGGSNEIQKNILAKAVMGLE